jgi:hypothetical protein
MAIFDPMFSAPRARDLLSEAQKIRDALEDEYFQGEAGQITKANFAAALANLKALGILAR